MKPRGSCWSVARRWTDPAARPRIVEVNAWWSAKQFTSENWKWFLSGIGGVIFAIGSYFGTLD
jgi:hypothetical protein